MSADQNNNESLYLIDAHSLIYQVFHALPRMSSPDGLPTNAVFGFTKDVLFVSKERKPSYLVVAFDVPGKIFREDISPDYKAHRPPMPDDLQLQIPMIRRLLQAMHVPIVGVPGFEADDVIATLATEAARKGIDVFICSSDKDCRQLLSDRIKIFSLRKREVFDRQALMQDWGIAPEQAIDFQTLVGDSVDNVKGVPGIGPKTATALLQQYQTLDNLLAHVDEIPGKKQENLRASAEIIKLTRQLVRLDTQVPIEYDWEHWRLQPWENDTVRELFNSWGMRGFARQVPAAARGQESGVRGQESGVRGQESGVRGQESGVKKRQRVVRGRDAEGSFMQGGLFGEEDNEPARDDSESDGSTPTRSASEGEGEGDVPFVKSPVDNWQATYRLVDTPEKFASFLANLLEQKRIALDLETTNLEPRRADIVGIAVCWRAGEAYYLPLRGPLAAQTLESTATLAQLKPILEDARIAKINQNIKYDMQVFRQHGIRLTGVVGDPMIADYLLHAGERVYSMEVLAEKHLKHQVIPITDLIGKGKNQKRMDEVPCDKVAEYSGEDADVAWRLAELLEAELCGLGLKRPVGQVANLPAAQPPSRKADAMFEDRVAVSGGGCAAGRLATCPTEPYLYDDLEIPLIDVLADMEFTGIRLDVQFLNNLAVDMEKQLADLEKRIHQLAGREFNINSVKQLREVLFKEQNLTSHRKTTINREASTDQESLERLARQGHELPGKLLEHRQIAKLKGTYVDSLPLLVNPSTGRVHASFNQTVAATGRLSSSDPNLQNIPIRTELGESLRKAFLPEPGWKLLSADYSQIELRLLADFCGDAELRRAFAENRDIHSMVAAQVFGVAESEVTSDQRRMAKTINFGLIYGLSAFGLAMRLEISQSEATKFIDAYFAQYPSVLTYQEKLLADCREKGYVSTILGRRRTIRGIRARTSYKGRNQPEREAINMQIQGSAADLIKVAMLNLHRLLQKSYRTRLLLQIHDELVFEVPPEELDELVPLIRREMAGALGAKLQVPIGVNIEVGDNWLEMEAVA